VPLCVKFTKPPKALETKTTKDRPWNFICLLQVL
jgi:hypothetical protein